jgi:ferric-dicitrate binding protein FerR (iron transport regulator)
VWPLLDWPGGLLVFQDTPFEQALAEIGRHFGREIEIGDEEVGKRRVTAWFEDEPLEEVISVVCLAVGARCRITDGGVVARR